MFQVTWLREGAEAPLAPLFAPMFNAYFIRIQQNSEINYALLRNTVQKIYNFSILLIAKYEVNSTFES